MPKINKKFELTKVAFLATKKQSIESLLKEKQFTLINKRAAANDKTGVLKYFSLSELIHYQNKLPKHQKKQKQPAILKAIYKGGVSGSYCIKTVPYLFYDIDIKPNNENKHLLGKTEILKETIKEHSIFVSNSFSKTGLYGLLYVPQLESIKNTDTQQHIEIAKQVYSKLVEIIKERTGLIVNFDIAQGKFRQIRLLSKQENNTHINLNPTAFYINIHELPKPEQKPIKRFKLTDKHTNIIEKKVNTIIENSVNHIQNATDGEKHAKRYAAAKVLGGLVASNLLTDSEAIQYLSVNFGKNKNGALKTIKDGIKDGKNKPITPESLLNEYNDYINKLNSVKQRKSSTKTTICINDYVSEKSKEITYLIEKYNTTGIIAPTGSGKTYAIINAIAKLLNKRVLIAVPLLAISEQAAKEYNIYKIDGKDTANDLKVSENIIIATYEQAAKVAHLYDMVFIDESHNLLNYQSFKPEPIYNLINSIRKNIIKTVYISATMPELLLNKCNHIIDIKANNYIYEKLNFYAHQKSPKNSFNSVCYEKHEGIKIVKFQNKNELFNVRNELIKNGIYKDDEIQVISNLSIDSNYYKLIDKGIFADSVKLVLTTSKINDGLNIKDKRVTEIVSIEKEYFINLYDLRQFVARLRVNKDKIKYSVYCNKNVFSKDKQQIINKYSILERSKKELQKKCDATNNFLPYSGSFDFNIFKEDNKDIVFDSELNKYVVNEFYLMYKAEISNFKQFNFSDIKEFMFNNFGIVCEYKQNELNDIEPEQTDNTNIDSELYELFTKHFRLLVAFFVQNTSHSDLRKWFSEYYNINKLDIFDYSMLNIELLKTNIHRVKLLLNRYKELYIFADFLQSSKNSFDAENLTDNEILKCFLFTENKELIKNRQFADLLLKMRLHTATQFRKKTVQKLDAKHIEQFSNIKMIVKHLQRSKSYHTIEYFKKSINRISDYEIQFFQSEYNVKLFINTLFVVKTDKQNKTFAIVERKNSIFELNFLFENVIKKHYKNIKIEQHETLSNSA